MATITGGAITASQTDYVLAKASAKLARDITKGNDLLTVLKKFGAVNILNDLSRQAGQQVYAYNLLRMDSLGNSGDVDLYDGAKQAEYGNRSLTINRLSDSIKYKKTGTILQQMSEINLTDGIPETITNWIKDVHTYSILNQLGGNTALTLTAPTAYSGSVTTTADKLRFTGFNTAIAPSSGYKAYGSLAAGSISADESVDSDNPLKMVDFQVAREVITGSTVGVPHWNLIMGQKFSAIAIIGETGYNQLKADAVTTGQGINFAQTLYATLAGGGMEIEGLKGISLPTFIMEGFLFVVVPDFWLPRGVNSSTSAAVANTRRAIIVGQNALDVAYGQGFTINGQSNAEFMGVAVNFDDSERKLNKEAYLSVESIYGCKKIQLTGFGGNESTAYDIGTYVITHYSRS